MGRAATLFLVLALLGCKRSPERAEEEHPRDAELYSAAVLRYAEASARCEKDPGLARVLAPLEVGDPLRVD